MPLRAPKGFIDESDPKVCLIGHPAPAWLVNYADLMTELVCFFVILYALSAALNKDVQKAAKEVKEEMEKAKIEGEVKLTKEGLRISMEEKGTTGFFDSGKADLTSTMVDITDKIAPKLLDLTHKFELIVEGHTDNIPISDEYFGSNWELSTARATTIGEYLIKQRGFPPSRMGAIGYGEFRPVAPNDAPSNRSRNRRVVFFVKTTGEINEQAKAAAAAMKAENAAALAPPAQTAAPPAAEQETPPPAEVAPAGQPEAEETR